MIKTYEIIVLVMSESYIYVYSKLVVLCLLFVHKWGSEKINGPMIFEVIKYDIPNTSHAPTSLSNKINNTTKIFSLLFLVADLSNYSNFSKGQRRTQKHFYRPWSIPNRRMERQIQWQKVGHTSMKVEIAE